MSVNSGILNHVPFTMLLSRVRACRTGRIVIGLNSTCLIQSIWLLTCGHYKCNVYQERVWEDPSNDDSFTSLFPQLQIDRLLDFITSAWSQRSRYTCLTLDVGRTVWPGPITCCPYSATGEMCTFKSSHPCMKQWCCFFVPELVPAQNEPVFFVRRLDSMKWKWKWRHRKTFQRFTLFLQQAPVHSRLYPDQALLSCIVWNIKIRNQICWLIWWNNQRFCINLKSSTEKVSSNASFSWPKFVSSRWLSDIVEMRLWLQCPPIKEWFLPEIRTYLAHQSLLWDFVLWPMWTY